LTQERLEGRRKKEDRLKDETSRPDEVGLAQPRGGDEHEDRYVNIETKKKDKAS
jgi:hypothetical protein